MTSTLRTLGKVCLSVTFGLVIFIRNCNGDFCKKMGTQNESYFTEELFPHVFDNLLGTDWIQRFYLL